MRIEKIIKDCHSVAMLSKNGYLIKSFERTILYYLKKQNIDACLQILQVAQRSIDRLSLGFKLKTQEKNNIPEDLILDLPEFITNKTKEV